MRRWRSIGLEKTHLQQVGIAAAINVDRAVAPARWRFPCSHPGLGFSTTFLCRLGDLPAVSSLVNEELISMICLKLRACSPDRNTSSIHLFTKSGHEPGYASENDALNSHPKRFQASPRKIR
jgi:hypothetical protein